MQLVQLVPKEKQLLEARARGATLSEQLKQLSSQLTEAQKDLQQAQQDTHDQVKVGGSQSYASATQQYPTLQGISASNSEMAFAPPS